MSGKHSLEKSSTNPEKKPKIMSDDSPLYCRKWTKISDDDPLGIFHRTWWGDPGKLVISRALEKDRFLQVTQIEVLDNLNILRQTKGSLYIRKEYEVLSNRLRKAREEVPDYDMSGVLLLGQPGIGKSFFLAFFLLECMSRCEIVLFNTGARSYLIDESGVMYMSTNTIEDTLDFPPSGRTWSLLDSPAGKVPIPSMVTYQVSTLFFVAALSPDIVRYKEAQKHGAKKWWMDPWKSEEIFALTTQIPFTNLDATGQELINALSAVQSLMKEVGPCPCDIIQRLKDPEDYDDTILRALQEYQNIRSIIDLWKNPEAVTNAHSHTIILVKRNGPMQENVFHKSDAYTISLKTPKVYQHVKDRIKALSLGEMKQMFQACSGIGPSGSVFAGHLFEGLAIGYTSGGVSDQGAFRLFTPMKSTDSKAEKFPIRYTYRAPGHTLMVVADHRGSILKLTPSGNLPTQAGDKEQMPWSHRTVCVYKSDEDFRVENSVYYTPDALHNPLFNAFFYQLLNDKIVVWILQMTIKREDDGSSKGFAIIDKLCRLALQRQPPLPVEVKYVLVVPYKDPGCDVEWNFAEEFEKYKGDVFVQFLDINTLGVDIDDILGRVVTD